MNDKTDRENSIGFLQSVLGTGTMISAWVFSIGWSYLHTYYRHFGLNINSLKFGSYQYFVFAFAQFVSFPKAKWILGFLALCAVLFVVWGTTTRKSRWIILLSGIYLSLFWLGFRVAYSQAHAAALKDVSQGSSLPRILIELKPGNESKYNLIDQTLKSSDLRLLLEDEDRMLVFVPVALGADPLKVRVLEINHKDVLFAVHTTLVARNGE